MVNPEDNPVSSLRNPTLNTRVYKKNTLKVLPSMDGRTRIEQYQAISLWRLELPLEQQQPFNQKH